MSLDGKSQCSSACLLSLGPDGETVASGVPAAVQDGAHKRDKVLDEACNNTA